MLRGDIVVLDRDRGDVARSKVRANDEIDFGLAAFFEIHSLGSDRQGKRIARKALDSTGQPTSAPLTAQDAS